MGIMVYSFLWLMQDLYHHPTVSCNAKSQEAQNARYYDEPVVCKYARVYALQLVVRYVYVYDCLSVCLSACLSVCMYACAYANEYGWMDEWMDGCNLCI